MLMIRLQRVGRKNDPSFRVVLTDSKNSTKSGRFLEVLGAYDARKGVAHFEKDRLNHWLSVGAKATVTVHNLLVAHKIVKGKKISAMPKRKPKAEEAKTAEAPKAEAPKEEAPAPTEAPTA